MCIYVSMFVCVMPDISLELYLLESARKKGEVYDIKKQKTTA